MTSSDDIDALAAEYVLGTLDAAERADVAARRQREPALDAAIAAWEQRLAPLGALVSDVAPPAAVFEGIERRLDRLSRTPDLAGGAADSDRVVWLQKRVTRWRAGALTAAALAACLAGVVVIQAITYLSQPQQFVAVFHTGDTQPAFVLSIDLSTRELTVRPVTAERHAGRQYQLWIASEELGAQPRSLGLLDVSLEPTRKRLDYPSSLLQKATFGVSLEPEGGSPTGQPTSPALHGRLIPATP